MVVCSGIARAEAVEVCFVPPERCGERVVAEIEQARRVIRVQAYQFTSRPIEAALEAARGRGVDVQIIVDKVNEAREGGAAARAVQAGIPVWTDDRPSIAHNKVIIIDDRTVVGGSYNYTYAAEHRNAENVTFIHEPGIIAEFSSNWERRRAASRPWMGERGEEHAGR